YVRTFYPGVADAASAQIIDLNYGEQVEIDPFVLPTPLPERALAGVVTWPDGSPAVGAWVSLQMRTRPQQPGEVIGRVVQTTTDGRFTMWAHLGRRYYVRAYVTHADGSYWSVDSAEFEVTSEPPMLTLKLERAPRR
ncbi:MAG TPA: hypothetical protein VG106_11415, partial [Vicinamibacterales bacterium]|nr:hypothetical protein [Vicinamibacterales bacterium]